MGLRKGHDSGLEMEDEELWREETDTRLYFIQEFIVS